MSAQHLQSEFGFGSAQSSAQPRWYATHTHSRREKQVAQQLSIRGIEAYLPLYTAVHRWNKRRAEVELPLFPSYVFVRIPLTERLRVLELPGVAGLVGIKGTPVPLDDNELELIRKCLSLPLGAEPSEWFGAGSRVRIKTGPLAGLDGVIVIAKNRARFIISVNLIMRSVAIDVDASNLERLNDSSSVPSVSSRDTQPS